MAIIFAIALAIASIKTFAQWWTYPDIGTAFMMGKWERQQWIVFDLVSDKWEILGTTFGVYFVMTFVILAAGWWAITHP